MANGTGQPGTLEEPLRGYHFNVMIDGQPVGQFTDCEGLAARIEPIAYRPGGSGPVTHQLPGPVAYAEVVLTRGLTPDATLWEWVEAVMAGRSDRRTTELLILDVDGVSERLRYTLFDAWPCQFVAAPLHGLEPMYACERLHLCYERFVRS